MFRPMDPQDPFDARGGGGGRGPQEDGGFIKSKPPRRVITLFIVVIVAIHAFLAYGFLQKVPQDPRLTAIAKVEAVAPACDPPGRYVPMPPADQAEGRMDHPPYLRGRIEPPVLVAERMLHGQLTIGVTVGSDGRVRSACLRASSGHQPLDLMVWASAMTWSFAPARQDGKAVEGFVAVPLDFPPPAPAPGAGAVPTSAG